MLIRLRFIGENKKFTGKELDALQEFKITYQNEDQSYLYDSSKGHLCVFDLYKRLTESLGYTDIVLATVADNPRLYEFALDRRSNS